MFGSIHAVSLSSTHWHPHTVQHQVHANTFAARKSHRMKEKNKNWPVHHETFLIQLYLSTQPSWDIRCYINSASLFGNPSPGKQLQQQQQRSTISDTEQKKCLGSRHFAPVPAPAQIHRQQCRTRPLHLLRWLSTHFSTLPLHFHRRGTLCPLCRHTMKADITFLPTTTQGYECSQHFLASLKTLQGRIWSGMRGNLWWWLLSGAEIGRV